MQTGLHNFQSNGGKVGAVPIGYVRVDKYHYVLDLEKADIIKQIFTDIASGMSTKEVVNKLEQINFRSNNNKPLGTREIRNIVKNKVYYKNIPQIVSKEQYLEANQQLRSIVNCDNKRVYPLSGKIFCKHCGTSLIIGYKVDRGYSIINSCNSSRSVRGDHSSKCSCQGAKYSIVEDIVKSDCLAYLEIQLSKLYDQLREDKELLSAHDAELQTVKAEISDNKEKLSKLNNLYLMDNISQEELAEKSAEIKNKISLLELKQQRLEGYSLFKISQEIQGKIIRLEEMQNNVNINDLVVLVDYVSYYKDTEGIQVKTVFSE